MKLRVFAFAVAAFAVPFFALAALSQKPSQPLHISHGKEVKLEDYLVPGKTTVFDFYSTFCPPCMRIAPFVEQVHATHADVVVIKVDINRPDVKGIDWESPVAKQFGLESIPHFKVYGPDGKLKAEDHGTDHKARDIVTAWFPK